MRVCVAFFSTPQIRTLVPHNRYAAFVSCFTVQRPLQPNALSANRTLRNEKGRKAKKAVRLYSELSAKGIEQLQCLFARISHQPGCIEKRQHAWEYLLFGPVERKNGWQPAEAAAHPSSCSLRHWFDRALWDGRRGAHRLERLWEGEPDGMPVADETGFAQKSVHSAEVQRQCGGMAGRIGQCVRTPGNNRTPTAHGKMRRGGKGPAAVLGHFS